jgi:hypothetical protein
MSEDRGAPPSAAEALYGPDGPVTGGPNYGRQRELIEGGIAKPDPRWFAEERTSPRSPSTPGSQNFDAARFAVPEGYSVNQPAMQEFSQLANEFGLNQRQAERALAFHQKIAEADEKAQRDRLEATWNSWHATSQRDLGHQLPGMVSDIRDAIAEHGDERDAARFYELLTWSGIEHDPATIRVLHALATGRRRY